MCESSAYQYRRNSTYTVPYAPAIALCANARHTKAHKISRINELPPQKGIFRVISCRALGPCSCPANGAPAGAAVVARLARHRLKPCRGDTAECCHKATRRSQGSWSRVIRPRRQASGCLSARCTCGEAVRSPDERSEELCEAKSQEGAREPRRGRKGPSAPHRIDFT